MTVNIRQNATLHWSYEISAGESYTVLWGTSDGSSVKELLFLKNEKQATPKPSSTMPAKFAGRVKILQQASLIIQRVDLSDEGSYICELRGEFLTARKTIKLIVIGECEILISLYFCGRTKQSATVSQCNQESARIKVEDATVLFVYL